MTSALETAGLGKRYGRRLWALRDCDITLPQGTVTSLVGPNGAGKTTLLHLAIGLLRHTEGAVSVFGEPSRMDRPAGLAQVGFVAQDHPLYRGFSVGDMLRSGRSLNPGWDQRYAVQRMDQLGISLRHSAGKLSGGQQAQLTLTLALAKRPRLLVLDEPVASLDPLGRRDFMRALVDSVATTDLTVLLSSHVVAELERVCDHLVLLASGRVRLAGSIDDLLGGHRIVVAAPDHQSAPGDGVITRTRGAGHTDLLIRTDAHLAVDPRWPTHPVGLEELVLAYLESSAPANRTGPKQPGRAEPMLWVAFRQHRADLLGGLVLLAAVGALLVVSGLSMHGAYRADGVASCVASSTDSGGREQIIAAFADRYVSWGDLLT